MTTARFNGRLDTLNNVGEPTIILLTTLFNCTEKSFDANRKFVDCIKNANSLWYDLSQDEQTLIAERIKQKLFADRANMTPQIISMRITTCIGSIRRATGETNYLEESLKYAEQFPEDEAPKKDIKTLYPHLFDDES